MEIEVATSHEARTASAASAPAAAGRAVLRFHLAMVGCLVAVNLVALGICHATSTTVSLDQLAGILKGGAPLWAPLLVVAAYAWKAASPRLLESSALIVWCWILTVGFSLPILAMARLRYPLRDASFAAFDEGLGFSVGAVAPWVTAHPRLHALMAGSYDSLKFAAVGAALAALIRNDRGTVRALVAGGMMSLTTATLVSAFVPAVGPWVAYGMPASATQARCAAAIEMARRSGPILLDLSYPKIVCFPSFHVILAVLSAWTLGRAWKPLRVPAVIWGGLIVASTVLLGWHYLFDALGGMVVASTCIAVTSRGPFVVRGSS